MLHEGLVFYLTPFSDRLMLMTDRIARTLYGFANEVLDHHSHDPNYIVLLVYSAASNAHGIPIDFCAFVFPLATGCHALNRIDLQYE